MAAGMLRLIAPVLLLVACDPGSPPGAGGGFSGGVGRLPDAYLGCFGAFQVVAPVADLHYVASMDVIVDETELRYELKLTMVDDQGTAYQYTTDSSDPDPDGMYWNRDKFHYELAASHRYDLTVAACDNGQPGSQTVTFFTSP
jgi:hypothetical protein